MHWLGWGLCASRVFVCFCIKSSIRTQGEVSWLWGCFGPPGGLLCRPFRGGGPVLVLLFVALWFILRGDLLCVFPCVILFLCFSVLLMLRLPRLGRWGGGGGGGGLGAFRAFVRFVLVWICRFPLALGVWEGLRFVIVALPGLFSYLFFNGPLI